MNVPETMNEVLDMSDDEGKIIQPPPYYALSGHFVVCIDLLLNAVLYSQSTNSKTIKVLCSTSDYASVF